MKVPARREMDAKRLRRTFMFLNSHFFNNKIPGSIRVEFMKNCGHKKKRKFERADAYFDKSRDAIFIDSLLRFFPDYVTICLLHEMVHAYQYFHEYEGYPVDQGHGTAFQGEIVRLIKIGAYDGLL